MVEAIHRSTRIEFSKSSLAYNVQYTKQVSGAKTLWLAVKSNAYGHGLLQVSKIARECGVDGLAVSVLDEGIAIRQAGIDDFILILGPIDVKYAPIASKYHFLTTVSSLDWLKSADKILGKEKLSVNLAVDTGMNRIGVRSKKDLKDEIEFLQEHSDHFSYDGIFTHFASSDNPDDHYFQRQKNRWYELIDGLIMPRYVHVMNSGAAMYHSKELPGCNSIARVGTVVYGVEPSEGVLGPIDKLKPVFELKSALTFVKKIPAGEGISYGSKFVTSRDTWIGTLPIGYGDGWLAEYQDFQLLIDGQKCRQVGQIAMDQMMVALPHEYPIGTEVTLIGKSGKYENTLYDLHKHSGVPPWKITVAFSDRLKRVVVD
ncbi:alanine racemase [Oenococcus oeni]|uniref:alanine racemase n=1 Tax=Oenococcus oeni TaxID=1247 RepID=UPI00050E2577|nr:alanine racemase [Oenococcus oeni]KGH56117.1 alanine racemase [Oenococcus oeni S22]KGH69010.1 alanine racemase [Oenococcus oeni S25]KGH79426.1 alanine racemase [Oenococcus oeni IOEB_0607]KGH88425.1 alanine racemase [Oenococcus oeni IOEB_L26_1]KGI01844.1 alanine racemase [Oenococcus oeni IOEB_C52]